MRCVSLPVLALSCTLLALSGCALSPQTINVTPTLDVAAGNVGQGHVVNVLVLDERSDPVIGSRGGVYAKSSVIRPANDVAAAVHGEMEKGLRAQGFRLGSADAQTVLHVGIEQLAYVVPEGAVATGADITVALRVTAERGDTKRTADYRSTVTRKFPVPPTATQNEAWINEVFTDTLARFFADEEMRRFITQ